MRVTEQVLSGGWAFRAVGVSCLRLHEPEAGIPSRVSVTHRPTFRSVQEPARGFAVTLESRSPEVKPRGPVTEEPAAPRGSHVQAPFSEIMFLLKYQVN